MLIKSDEVTSQAGQNLISVKNEEGKHEERFNNDNESRDEDRENNFPHLSSQRSERRLGKSSSFLDITEITPYLYLCGAVALRGNILEDLGVTCVINATKELPDTPLPNSSQQEILYLRVNVDDKADSNILPWLDLVADIIYQSKTAGGKTLIHCVAGISRSATLCLAYLIKYEDYSLYDSYYMLKALRNIIRPNSGFFGQLVEFEKQTTGKQTVVMVQSEYTNSRIPQLYEEDYKKFYSSRHRRAQP